MRKIIIGIFVLSLFSSCDDYKPERKTLQDKIDGDLSKVDINERINESMKQAKEAIKKNTKEPLKLDSISKKKY